MSTVTSLALPPPSSVGARFVHDPARSPLDAPMLLRAAIAAFRKLDPRHQVRNPVMFVTETAAALATLLLVRAILATGETPAGFIAGVAVALWLTVLAGTFAEALAQSRGRARAASLCSVRREVTAKRLVAPRRDADWYGAPASELRRGDAVLVEVGDTVPADGEVIEGVASVDESVITGESAPVLRESGGDRSAVTGGSKVLSDWLVVRVTAQPGEAFLDRMLSMAEGTRRRMAPSEVGLYTLLASLSILVLVATAMLLPLSTFAARYAGAGAPLAVTVLLALLICGLPTTVGALLPAIGIAGMDRLMRANVVATSGLAVEAAADADVLLLDKTGTITLGDRHAVQLLAASGVREEELAAAAQLASLADETPEGRSIVALAKQRFGIRGRNLTALGATLVPYSAATRMSGVDLGERRIRKGALDAIGRFVAADGGAIPDHVRAAATVIARHGGTPLAVAEGRRVLGLVQLKDVVKGGIRSRFAELRRMGIRTVLITGDNPLTAAAIAAEAGIDDFLAEATPEAKLRLIREHQAAGRLVAMAGDGTNDAPALAQADVSVAMNSGTQAAKEASNMVDLDSNPTKLVEIVAIGKQLLMTRGALTTFSIASNVSTLCAAVPAVFLAVYPPLAPLNVMRLATPTSAVLAAVIFNALVIAALIPQALFGVRYRPLGAPALLRRNVAVYGLGGLLTPFVGIKLIDTMLVALGLA